MRGGDAAGGEAEENLRAASGSSRLLSLAGLTGAARVS
jgi:hypothetical protein